MTRALQQRVVQGLRSAALPAHLQGPRTWLAQVEQSLTPLIGGWVVDGPTATGESKLGGAPDLPPELSWPSGVAGPLAFICQINLSEVWAHDEAQRLPDAGVLHLFALCDEQASYAGELDEFNSAVLYTRDISRLAARPTPDALPARARLREKKLQFAPSLWCQRRDPGTGHFQPVRFDVDIEAEIARLLQASGSHAPDVRMLCDASFFRRELAESYHPDHELELLGFAGELASRQFGEGEVHVVIDVHALEAGELGSARLLFEPGT